MLVGKRLSLSEHYHLSDLSTKSRYEPFLSSDPRFIIEWKVKIFFNTSDYKLMVSHSCIVLKYYCLINREELRYFCHTNNSVRLSLCHTEPALLSPSAYQDYFLLYGILTVSVGYRVVLFVFFYILFMGQLIEYFLCAPAYDSKSVRNNFLWLWGFVLRLFHITQNVGEGVIKLIGCWKFTT